MIDYTWKSKGATGNVRPKQRRPQRDKGQLLTLVRLGGLGWHFGRGWDSKQRTQTDGYPFSQQESTA